MKRRDHRVKRKRKNGAALDMRHYHLLTSGLTRSLAVPSISLLNTIDPILRTPLGGVFENAVLLNLLQGGFGI